MVATGEHCHTQWCNHLNSVFVYSMSEWVNYFGIGIQFYKN